MLLPLQGARFTNTLTQGIALGYMLFSLSGCRIKTPLKNVDSLVKNTNFLVFTPTFFKKRGEEFCLFPSKKEGYLG